ncbi:hypothetical protein LSH36_1017g00004 [Paralvinella palmiformis]|uniref:Secreted protein n=1 Tax=Paralvinella palmiformis TaxID=53620 RepID=A0AAD9MQ79_9ANNE|nr:hypothetical protein LSH36_1017g00004 [Paralvinella palmiformis]
MVWSRFWLTLIPHIAAVHTEESIDRLTMDKMQSSTVSTCHVECTPMWKILHWLKAECAQVSTTLPNASCGEPPRRRVKRVDVRHQSSLHQLCIDRSEGTKTVGEFLRDAGHNIR